MAPRISVLIGAYQSAATLPRAIESILAQTVSDLELIVVDDGSTDGSAAVAREAAARDPRARVLEMGANVGIARSLNAGIEAARAPVVAVQDADDHSEPERLERQLALLDEHPDVAVVGVRMHETDGAGRALVPRTSFAPGDVGGVLLRFNPIPNSAAAFRREAVLAAGGYDAAFRFAMDLDLWLRLADAHRIVTIDEPLATRVMTGSNVAARHERAQIAEVLRIQARTLRRRRTLRGLSSMAVVATAWATPPALKRARRRALGQAP